MKKSLILGLLLSATVVTACGGAGNSSKPSGSTPSTPKPSTPTPSVSTPKPSAPAPEELGVTLEELKNTDITVTFWHTMGAKNMEYLDAMITNFNAIYPNITIEHDAQGGYDDIKEKILTAIPANNTPVMAYAYPDHVAEYIDAGASVRLNDYIADPVIGFGADDGISTGRQDGVEDYVAGFWQEGASYDNIGSVYSVPYTKSTEALFVNKTFLINNGFVDADGNPIYPTKWENEADPTDYTAMINLCRAIKAKYPNITPLGYDSDDNLYITLSKQYDIPYTSLTEANGSIRGSIDFAKDIKAVEMVKKVKTWFDEGLIVTKGTLPNNTYTSTKFTGQEIIMSVGSTGGTSYNVPAKDSDGNYEFEAEVIPVPQNNSENPAIISQGPSITFFQNKNITKLQKAAAWLFYKFITNTENTAAWSIKTGYEPVRLSAYNSSVYQAHLNKLGTAQETLYTKVANMTVTVTDWYFTSPAFKGSATARQQVGGIITTVCLNDVSKMSADEYDKYVKGIFEIAYTETILAQGA